MSTQASELDPERPATMVASRRSRLIGYLEELPLLETAQKKVMGWLQPVLEAGEARGWKDVLHGRQLGHALHPVAVNLPIGFWTSAWVLDLLGARKSARLLTGSGCLSALLAVASGTADWSATDGRERRLGLLHGTLNIAGLAFQSAALVSRRHYRLWSWSGACITTAAAYLGGELVFSRGLMVDHDAWVAGPRDWTSTCRMVEIPDGGLKGVQVEGRRVLLHRNGMQVSAMENACSHLGGPLDEGTIRNDVIECPWHGSQFRLDNGACVRGPATFPQLRLLARVVEGTVQVKGRAG